jgi:pimeloyl-CoA synthetase
MRGTHRVVHKHAVHTTVTMILNKWQLFKDSYKQKTAASSNVNFPQATFSCGYKSVDKIEYINILQMKCSNPEMTAEYMFIHYGLLSSYKYVTLLPLNKHLT